MSRTLQPNLIRGARKPKPIRGDGRSEHDHQARFISWCRDSARLQADTVKREALEWLHAIPNGAYLSKRQALKLIAEGLTAGIHDLRLDYVLRDNQGCVNCPGLIIEMKLAGNNYSNKQKAYRDFMYKQGFKAALCRNWQEAAYTVIEYMGLKTHAPIYPRRDV